MSLLLDDLYAFYLEHRRCGELPALRLHPGRKGTVGTTHDLRRRSKATRRRSYTHLTS